MLPKSERRALGKQAAARRAVARRRRALLRKLTPYAAVLGVIGVVVLAFVVFGGSKPATDAGALSADASPTPSPEITTPAPVPTNPPDADPALQTKPTVTKGTGTLTKLVTTTLIEGKGEAIQSGQTISVNYVGVHFDTGEEFDSSWSRGQPIEFPIGVGQVIQGWDQGLVGVKIGSRVQLDIPSELAYPNPQGGQPAGPLRFVVDILGAR
jgi:peptidylprolyl isomerase